MHYFQTEFNNPSKRLTLELARELDDKIQGLASSRSPPSLNLSSEFERSPGEPEVPQDTFNRKFYKQPVMTEAGSEPMFYRIDRKDPLTKATRDQLQSTRIHMWHPSRNAETRNQIV